MCSHIPLKERTQIRKVKFQKWRHKNGSTVFMLPQKPEEIHSAIRKVWWLDNSRARNPQQRLWISEQSPIRFRGTSSRHSAESVSNQNFTRDGEEFFTKVPVAVAEAISFSFVQLIRNLASIVKNYHGTSEQLHFIYQTQAELQTKLYVEQKKRHRPFYCNLDQMISGGRILRNAVAICEMTKPSWQTENLKMNEDLVHLFAGGEFGKKIFWLLRSKNWKSWMHQKYIPEDWMRKKSW